MNVVPFFGDSGRCLPGAQLLGVFALLMTGGSLLADPLIPSWWAARGATDGNPPDSYAAANIGQLKHIASKALVELDAKLPGGAGQPLRDSVDSWYQPPAVNIVRDDSSAVTVGQLKYIGRLFYDRLIAVGHSNAYPWTPATNDDNDSAVANLGQIKYIFAFDVALDLDQNGLADWWEQKQFGQTGNSATADPDTDGLTNLQEYWQSSNPTNRDTNGDGISDGIAYFTGYRLTTLDDDEDGLSNAQELLLGTNLHQADTDGDGVNDSTDPLPLDPNVSSLPAGANSPGPPLLSLLTPPGAVPVP